MCSGLSRRASSCSKHDFRAGSGNHVNRDSKFAWDAAYGNFPSWNSVKTLVRYPVNIDTYYVTLHDRMLLGEASRPVAVSVLVSRRLNGKETHHRG